MIVILIISINLPFTIFTEALKNLREWYHLTLKPSPMTTETKNRKNRILNNVNQLYNKYFDTYKKKRLWKFKRFDFVTYQLSTFQLNIQQISKFSCCFRCIRNPASVVVFTNARLHSPKPELGSSTGSNLVVACWIFAMVWTSDNGPGWKLD